MEKIFPYEKIRESQIDLINDISLAIKTENHLIAHAPTGIGKSAASLTAALKYALEKKKTIFIITPKHTQHKIIIETVRLINQKTKVVAADFIGKKWMCCIPGIDTLSNQEFSGVAWSGTQNQLTIVGQQALVNNLYVYMCNPNPSKLSKDYFVLTNSSTPLASDRTLGTIKASAAVAKTSSGNVSSKTLSSSSSSKEEPTSS